MGARTDRRWLQALPVDIAIGLLAGLAATQVTNLAQGPLRALTPNSALKREKRVRPSETSSLVAAKQLNECLDLSPDPHQAALLGNGIHFFVGTIWGLGYPILRRGAGLGPWAAGLTLGAAMSLLLDEAVVPALGLSAPNRNYPLATHVRGFAAHLIYGAAVAGATEGLGRVVRQGLLFREKKQRALDPLSRANPGAAVRNKSFLVLF